MDIEVTELKERLDKGEELNILDVRNQNEFDAYNINGKLIPVGQIGDRVSEIEDWKEKEVIVHCKAGGRSAKAKAFLERQGFSNVRNLLGGMDAYSKL